MPRKACRIELVVKNVRVERVQDITREDIFKEGIEDNGEIGFLPEAAWWNLWDSINEKRGFGYSKNPWVWVVEFEVKK